MQPEEAHAETIYLLETIYMLDVALLLHDVAPSHRTADYRGGRLLVRLPWWHWLTLGVSHLMARRKLLRAREGIYEGRIWVL